MAKVMPPATEAVMSVLPRERAGAGSSLNNTARQVAVALGVAVLGSILAQVYRGKMAAYLAGLPAGARGTASASIAGTQAVAQQLGRAGERLLVPANNAFVDAMHVTSLISAAIALVGAIVVFIWMPGVGGRRQAAQPGEQAAAARPEHDAATEPAATVRM